MPEYWTLIAMDWFGPLARGGGAGVGVGAIVCVVALYAITVLLLCR